MAKERGETAEKEPEGFGDGMSYSNDEYLGLILFLFFNCGRVSPSITR